jgi:hypothetical protein
MIQTVSFPRFPTWNYHFPELDVERIRSVKYWPKGVAVNEAGQAVGQLELALDQVRLTCGNNGVSGVWFKDAHELPATAERPDAVTIEYEV